MLYAVRVSVSLLAGAVLAAPAITAEPIRAAFGAVPPLSFKTADGRPAGFTIDVFNEAARRERMTLVWTAAGPSLAIESALKQKLLDIVPAGMITPDRRRMFYVSAPWWFAELSLLSHADETPSELAGKRLALGSPIYHVLAQKEFPDAIQMPFNDATEASIAFCRGEADAALLLHMEVHQVFFARPDQCLHEGISVEETRAEMDLAIIARPGMQGPAERLRRRIDQMALDGTLANLAARYPSMPSAGAVRLADNLRARYSRQFWRSIAISALVILVLGGLLTTRLYGELKARRRAQSEAQTSQARLARAHRMAALGDWEIDLRSGEAYLSERLRALFQCDAGAGRNGWDTFLHCVASEDAERVREAFNRAAAGHTIDINYAIESEQGRRYVRQLAGPLRSEAGAARVVGGAVQDMTEYRELEEQLRQAQKMESVGQLAGGVAHDFNNLLTVISGYSARLLAAMAPQDQLRQWVEEIAHAANMAASLTRQLLTFSRRQVIQPRTISLNESLRNLEKMLRRLIGEDIELVLQLDETEPAIQADAGQIDQLVLNLVVNARDAMPGGGKITIRTALRKQVDRMESGSAEPAGDAVELSVADNGAGIPPAVISRIFEPFFTTKERGKGTGLGLSMVYGIVKQNGGAIQVHSEPGAGTTFEVLFPVAERVALTEAAAEEAKPGLTGGETILIVEDEPSVRKYIGEILASNGYNAIEAQGGREALRLAREHQGNIDLLLSDVIMPEMGGLELTERFVELRPATAIVYMSGYTDRPLPQEIADTLLQKPFTPSALLERIRESLPEARLKSAGPAASEPPTPRSGIILLAEDEAAVRLFAEDILSEAGYRVLSAHNGRAALALAENLGERIDVLITDVTMPEMTGPELATALRALMPHLMVVYTSGYSEQRLPDLKRGGGGASFLEKPFEPQELLRTVADLFSTPVSAG